MARIVFAILAFALLGVASATAELSARGDLFVRFDGGIKPRELPRHALAPVTIRVAGTVRSLSRRHPPALRRISILLNRAGKLDTKGLPVCPRSRIGPSSSEVALAACENALVGRGSYVARNFFPGQKGFNSPGRILAFNSRVNGHRAIVAHVYGEDPAPTSDVIVFDLRKRSGTFGTVLSGDVPAALSRWGYLKRIRLSFGRRYTYRGVEHSYIRASCAAAPGFTGAVFPLARTSMSFADGRTLSSVLTRTCRVSR